MTITSEHIGRTVEFDGCNYARGITQRGIILEIQNGYATVAVPYYSVRATSGRIKKEQTKSRDPWRQAIQVNDPRIQAIY